MRKISPKSKLKIQVGFLWIVIHHEENFPKKQVKNTSWFPMNSNSPRGTFSQKASWFRCLEFLNDSAWGTEFWLNDAPPNALKNGASYTLVTKQANLDVDKCHKIWLLSLKIVIARLHFNLLFLQSKSMVSMIITDTKLHHSNLLQEPLRLLLWRSLYLVATFSWFPCHLDLRCSSLTLMIDHFQNAWMLPRYTFCDPTLATNLWITIYDRSEPYRYAQGIPFEDINPK